MQGSWVRVVCPPCLHNDQASAAGYIAGKIYHIIQIIVQEREIENARETLIKRELDEERENELDQVIKRS